MLQMLVSGVRIDDIAGVGIAVDTFPVVAATSRAHELLELGAWPVFRISQRSNKLP